MNVKRLVAVSLILFLAGCSENVAEEKPIEEPEVVAAEETKVEDVPVGEAAVAEEAPEINLADYEGEWQQVHEEGDPYLSMRIEQVDGNQATVYIDAMSYGDMYIASAGGDVASFEEGKTVVAYEDDGFGSSGEIAVELLNQEIRLTVAQTIRGQGLWEVPEGKFILVKKPVEAVVQEPEEPVEEVALETIDAKGIKGNPESDEAYTDIAARVMGELWNVMNEMYNVYSFGNHNPGSYGVVKPHIIHLVTAEFGEGMFSDYIAEYYCECDSGLMPDVNEQLSNRSIAVSDENTFQIIGDFQLDPYGMDPTTMIQTLEFKRENEEWKLNNWTYSQ